MKLFKCLLFAVASISSLGSLAYATPVLDASRLPLDTKDIDLMKEKLNNDQEVLNSYLEVIYS